MSDANPTEPVHLIEDADTGDRFLIYGTDKGIKVELRYERDNLWLTQANMAEMFGVDRSVITKHLANAYEEGEIDPGATSAKIAQVRQEGGRSVTRQIEHYNLDAIISVGYRVSSTQGTMFRKWATEKLVRFATKGFVVDIDRLKGQDAQDRLAELREVIRDIRADEANVYRELRQICAMCRDYDAGSEAWREFYQRTQAKLMWAVTSKTPSEMIAQRADASRPNMGLQTWPKSEIRKQDVEVAKNYLSEREVKELNRLTTILLDIFEDQLDIGKLTTMGEAEEILNRQLVNLNRPVLRSGGSISSVAAKAHAGVQYSIFNENRRALRHARADADIAELKQSEKAIVKQARSRTVKPKKT